MSHVRAALAVSGVAAPASWEEIFRLLTEQAPVGVFVASAAGQYEYVNQHWCRLAGLASRRRQRATAGWPLSTPMTLTGCDGPGRG